MPQGCQIVGLLIFLSIWCCSAEYGTKAHHFMSEDDLRKIFQVEHHGDVPKYEVIRIHSVRHKKRSSSNEDIHRVRLETQGKRLNLELIPNRHLLRRNQPVGLWFAEAGKSANSSIDYVLGPEDTEPVGDVYHDERNRAAMLLYRDRADDALLMDGTIGDDLVVKPLPSKIRSKIEDGSILASFDQKTNPSAQSDFEFGDIDFESSIIRHTNETDDYEFLDEDDSDALVKNNNLISDRGRSKREVRSEFHIVFKRKNSQSDNVSDYHFMEMDQFPIRPSFQTFANDETLRRTKRQAPYIIFPEILCIIDYDGYRLHGKDNIAIKRYVISFWNGIDLRYKLLKHPSVKISIAGIIISRGRDATPYLERNRVGNDALDSASALTDMGKYLFLERRLPVYDIAVAITKLDMCRRKSRYGECNRGTAGFAYVGGACVVNKRLEKVNSVAIVEDTGGFSGIIVAAHELGHLLGAVHDGSPPPSYLGGPGAGKCRWEDGFIMSDLRHTSKGFRWSHCTINQFKHFLNGETATCMYNSPHETESLPRVLPGKLLTLDAQCRKDRGTSACFKDGRVCAQLFCFDAASGYCVSYRPAAEGSRCGDGQMCLNGKCVLEHENSIDYEGNGFLRKLGEVDDDDDYGVGDSPAEPSNTNTRKWWNQLQTSEKRASSTSSSTTSTTTTSTITTTSLTTTTTTSSSTTSTSASTLTLKDSSTASTTTRAPWWRRIQRRPPLGAFFIPQPPTKAPKSIDQTTITPSTVPTSNPSITSSSSTTSASTIPLVQSTILTTTTNINILSTRNSVSFTSTPPSTSPTPNSLLRSSTRSKSRSELLSISDRSSDASSNEGTELEGSCEDRITNIAGSLTCKAFLRSFAYQYCRHKYIRTNCCESHKVYCSKTPSRHNPTSTLKTQDATSQSSSQGEQQHQQRRRRQQEHHHSLKSSPNDEDSLSAPNLLLLS